MTRFYEFTDKTVALPRLKPDMQLQIHAGYANDCDDLSDVNERQKKSI